MPQKKNPDVLELTRGYLTLLDRYAIGWAEVRTDHPGRIVYEDPVQVIAVPPGYPRDWPFALTAGAAGLRLRR